MRIAAILVTVALALGVAAAVTAQEPAPTVTITAGDSLNVAGTGSLESGPTRFEVVNTRGAELEITIAALRPGATLEQFTTALRSRDSESAIDFVHLDGGVSVSRQDQRRAVTLNLRPNATYVIINGAGQGPSDLEVTTPFTVGGQANGAAPPRAAASVRMIDLRFRGAKTLPRRGVVRFENAGWAPHFAFAVPLRRGASKRAVGNALRFNRERRLEGLVDFRAASQPQPLITRGAVNYNEMRFRRRGRHVMVCFFENHHTQGMYGFIRVR